MILTCLPSDLRTGWGVCGHYVNRELARLRLIALIPPHCPPGKLEGALLCGMFPHSHVPGLRHVRGVRNCGCTFFERNYEAMRNIANAWLYWDWVATGSSWCERWLRKAGYTNCSTVLQGVDHAIFYPAAESRIRDRFVVFSGGCFQYRKAQDVVIAAMRVMMQRHTDVYLAGAWGTPSPQQDFRATMTASRLIQYWGGPLAEACAQNGLDMRRVRLYPARGHSAMAQIYRASDVGLFPNRCEGGTNLVLMEYLACGKPAIATTATGHSDILTPQNCLPIDSKILEIEEDGLSVAQWVEPDLDHVIARLEEAYQEPGRLQAIAEQAAASMLPWTWDRTARGLLAILEARQDNVPGTQPDPGRLGNSSAPFLPDGLARWRR